MTEYVWEFGIDWNAVETEDVSYLRGGLATGGVAVPGTAPVKIDDTVIFKILDMTSSEPPEPRVASDLRASLLAWNRCADRCHGIRDPLSVVRCPLGF